MMMNQCQNQYIFVIDRFISFYTLKNEWNENQEFLNEWVYSSSRK